MIREEDIISAGTFLKTHGLHGELNVETNYPIDILKTGTAVIVKLDGLFVPFMVAGVRTRKQFAGLVQLEDIDVKEDADVLVGKELYLLKSYVAEFLDCEIEEIEQDCDLTGYTLEDNAFGMVGVITHMDFSTPNVLMSVSVDGEEGEVEEIILPFHEDFITGIDDDKRVVTMDLPDGCLDINR